MSSGLDKATVHHVAELARLKITPEEASRFSEQLSDVLNYMRQLDELDTRDVSPTAHALPLCNVLRDDVPRPPLDTQQALANAPRSQDGFFRVPKVLDQGGGG